MEARYTFFDHTADAGFDVAAPTLITLFETAAAGLFDILTDPRAVRPEVERSITVTGGDHEELLVRWLAELLYLHDTEGLLFSSFKVRDLSDRRLEGSAWGEVFDPSRHIVKTELKAVTYHQVSVRPGPSGWTGRVVVDV